MPTQTANHREKEIEKYLALLLPLQHIMSTEPTLSTGSDASCRFCCTEQSTKHCYEKMCKPRCKRISVLIDDQRQTMAIAKGLAYHRKYTLCGLHHVFLLKPGLRCPVPAAVRSTPMQDQVKPLLKPINDYSKLGAFKKP